MKKIISLITVMTKATADCRNVYSTKVITLDQNLRTFVYHITMRISLTSFKIFTHKYLSYFSLLFVYKGECPLGLNHLWVFFSVRISIRNLQYNVYIPKITIIISAKRTIKNCFFFNVDQRMNYHFAKKITWPKSEKWVLN